MKAELKPLARRYDVVVANPPYMGSGNMNKWLSTWIKDNYASTSKDLCTCFITRGMGLAWESGYVALITSDTCMYISSFEKMRKEIIGCASIIALIDTRGTNAHPDVFDANAGWVLWNSMAEEIKGSYFKLNHPIAEKEARLLEALANPDCGWFYKSDANGYGAIPGSPIAYWLSERSFTAFKSAKCGDVFVSVGRTKTHNNDVYLRRWWEVSISDKDIRWHPYANGGGFSRWAGLEIDLVDWSTDAIRDYESHGGLPNMKRCNDIGICWGLITSSKTSFRIKPAHFKYSSGSPTIVSNNQDREMTTLAFLNSSVSEAYLKALNPTLNTTVGDVMSLPCPNENELVIAKAQECIDLVSIDWGQHETAWQFKRHPLA